MINLIKSLLSTYLTARVHTFCLKMLMNNIDIINSLLIEGRKLSDHLEKKYKKESLEVLQITSVIALKLLKNIEIRYSPLVCAGCGRTLNIGMEIEFYKYNCKCFNCDSGYVDNLENTGYTLI